MYDKNTKHCGDCVFFTNRSGKKRGSCGTRTRNSGRDGMSALYASRRACARFVAKEKYIEYTNC